MGHNVRILPDRSYANGLRPLVGTSTDEGLFWNALDVAQFQSVNGDDGGTWTPGTPLFIGGAGLWCCGPTPLGSAYQIETLFSVRIVHAADDVPLLSPSHTACSRELVTSCSEALVTRTFSRDYRAVNGLPDDGGGIKSPAYPTPSGPVFDDPWRILVPLRVHNGARFLGGGVEFLVPNGAARGGAFPDNRQAARIWKVDGAGKRTVMSGGTSSGDGAGWYQADKPTPSGVTPVTWYADPQSISIGVASLTEIIDTSTYTYFCEIIDEWGQNAIGGNIFRWVRVFFDSINDVRFP